MSAHTHTVPTRIRVHVHEHIHTANTSSAKQRYGCNCISAVMHTQAFALQTSVDSLPGCWASSLPWIHTHKEGEFVPIPSSLVYFWGDEKMIKAMWPDSRNDLLTVSGVSYYTRKYTHAYTRTFISLLHMQAHTQVISQITVGNILEKCLYCT